MKYIFFLLLLFTCRTSFSQYKIDSISLDGELTAWYDQQIGRQNTILQHGEIIVLDRKSPNSHPYYGESRWEKASLTYCNQTFHNVDVLYNIEDDLLIIANNLSPTTNSSPIQLRKELVSHFSIGDSHFKYIGEPVGWHENNFFKMPYSGENISLLSKIFKKLELTDGLLTYRQNHHYFLQKENKYYRVKSLRSILKLYPGHKKEIRQYRKQLSFRDIDKPANENKLASLIEYCDKLK